MFIPTSVSIRISISLYICVLKSMSLSMFTTQSTSDNSDDNGDDNMTICTVMTVHLTATLKNSRRMKREQIIEVERSRTPGVWPNCALPGGSLGRLLWAHLCRARAAPGAPIAPAAMAASPGVSPLVRPQPQPGPRPSPRGRAGQGALAPLPAPPLGWAMGGRSSLCWGR